MNRALKKILIFLLLIIVVPALSFAVYEFSSLNDTEELLAEIYSMQLELIIFSVNQYSEDVVSGWRTSVSNIAGDVPSNRNMESFVQENPAIRGIFVTDTSGSKVEFSYAHSSISSAVYSDSLRIMLSGNQGKISRLFTYERGGYYKIEPLDNTGLGNNTVLIFILQDRTGKIGVGGMIIDSQTFARDIIGPRIKNMTEREIAIGVYNEMEVLYGTDEFDREKVESNKALWILPGYELGIALRGDSIQSFVKERTVTNLILISAISFLLIVGAVLIFRSIKSEVELAQIKSDFVSNVSHELRTPLALIAMFAETLEMGRVKTEEKKNEYYSIISRETSRLSRIVNKILNFSQIEAGKRKYHFEQRDLNEVIERVYNNYKFHLQNSGFKFTFYPAEDIPLIDLDAEAVSEAVINLIDNGMKYSKENKEISITTGKENGYVYAAIKDKGIGIAEEDRKKIFDKFFRVSTGDVHNVKGTGLGLTIVSHIVSAHSGEIELNSKISEGSTFKLKFPIKNGEKKNE